MLSKEINNSIDNYCKFIKIKARKENKGGDGKP